MSSLAPVLSPADLSWVELQAARLDGDVYELADGFCLIGELEGPRHRALAVLGARSPRLIAELATAAWIWGAAPAPARPTFSVTPEARARLAHDQRTSVREVVYLDDDLVAFGSVRVTSPLRTVLDLARAAEFGDRDAATVVRLAALGGLGLDACLASLAARAGLPAKRRAAERLTAALRGAGQAVETR